MYDKIYKKGRKTISTNGDLPVPINQPEFISDCDTAHLKFEILDNKKQWRNLLDICGLDVLGKDFSINFPKFQTNTFLFTYQIEHFMYNETDLYWDLAKYMNEIKISRGDTVIFTGYVHDTNQIDKQNDIGVKTFKASVVGTEKVYFTQNLFEKTSWFNQSSKVILTDLQNIVKSKINHGFADWEIHPNLKHVFQDNLQMSGQYSRVFDIIKEKEVATYGFMPHGKVKFIRDEDFTQGTDLTNDVFGNSIEEIKINTDSTPYANQVVFIAKNIKGSLQKETIDFDDDGDDKTTNPNEFNGDVDVNYPIYKVKHIHTGGQYNHDDWIYDPSFKFNKNSSMWRYNFTDNTIKLSKKKGVKQVIVDYWRQSSGVYILDLESQVIKQFDMRELTSQHYVVEITNERIKSTQDMLEYMKMYLDYRQRDQVTIDLCVDNATVNHPVVTEFHDFNKYKFNLKEIRPKMVGSVVTDELHPIRDIDNLSQTIKNDLFVKEKTFSLVVAGSSKVDNKVIELSRFKVDIKMESDKSHNPENVFARDKHEWQRDTQTRTINLVKHDEWQFNKSNSCEDKKQIPYTIDNIIGKAPATITDIEPKGFINLEHKITIKTETATKDLNQKPSDDKAKLDHCVTFIQGGHVFVQMTFPEIFQNHKLADISYYPHADAGITFNEVTKWIEDQHKSLLPGVTHVENDKPYVVYVPNSGWWGAIRVPDISIGSASGSYVWQKFTVAKFPKWHAIDVNMEIVDPATGLEATGGWRDGLKFEVFIPDRVDLRQTPVWINPATNKVQFTPIIKDSPNSFKITYDMITGKIALEGAKGWYWFNYRHSAPNHAISGNKCDNYKIREGYRHYYKKSASHNAGVKNKQKDSASNMSLQEFSTMFGH